MLEDLLLQADDIRQELDELGDRSKPKSRREILMDQLNVINKALGEKEVQQDPLWDYWEECLARGETPDLDMTVEDLETLRRTGNAY